MSKLEGRTYNVVGVTSEKDSSVKVRYATDQVAQRERHYLKFGATFAYFAALPKPMTKMDIVAYLIVNPIAVVFGDRVQGSEMAIKEGIVQEAARLADALDSKEPKKRGPKPKAAAPAKEKAVKPKKAKTVSKSKKKTEKKVEAPASEFGDSFENEESTDDWRSDIPILDEFEDDSVDLTEFEAMAKYND